MSLLANSRHALFIGHQSPHHAVQYYADVDRLQFCISKILHSVCSAVTYSSIQ